MKRVQAGWVIAEFRWTWSQNNANFVALSAEVRRSGRFSVFLSAFPRVFCIVDCSVNTHRIGRLTVAMETSCKEKLARGVCVSHAAAEAAPQKATISVSCG